MKVSQNNNVELHSSKPLAQAAVAAKPAAAAAAETARALVRNPGVPVTVSSSARSLDETAKSSADVDMAKVQAMRAAIAAGTFRVNAGTIADRLLGDAGQMLLRA